MVRIATHIVKRLFRYYLPGDDHGSYEDPFNTWAMLMNSTNIQVAL